MIASHNLRLSETRHNTDNPGHCSLDVSMQHAAFDADGDTTTAFKRPRTREVTSASKHSQNKDFC